MNQTNAPWPVRRGGVILWIYAHSLSLAMLALFGLSFAWHAIGGWEAYCEDLVEHGAEPVRIWDYLWSARFWFESLQNWQSEFLAILLMVVLSIYLRESGSPQSKPVAAPHQMTGA